MKERIAIPACKLCAEDAGAERRKKLREMLSKNEDVRVTSNGTIKPSNEIRPEDGNTISIPSGKLAAEDAGAERRKKLREMLKGGQNVKVTKDGTVKPANEVKPEDGNTIVIPSGILAASIYWYEKDKELYDGEVKAMKYFFPNFRLEKLPDGRLSWVGEIKPVNVRQNASWLLQLVYDHNHPHNNSFGGSIRVYAIEPDLEELQKKLGESIPHLLRDSAGNICLCTARKEDVKVGKITTSAASALSWAAKWITVFELWLAGDVTSKEFMDHTF